LANVEDELLKRILVARTSRKVEERDVWRSIARGDCGLLSEPSFQAAFPFQVAVFSIVRSFLRKTSVFSFWQGRQVLFPRAQHRTLPKKAMAFDRASFPIVHSQAYSFLKAHE
jgi:hypothetical protein